MKREDGTRNVEWTPFHAIGHDIKVAIDNGAPMGAVILTYAAIDAMAFLSMPEIKKEVTREDYIGWTEKYLKADQGQPYQYVGIDVYGARCGLFHRYSGTSNLSDKGRCRVFAYHDGSEHIYRPRISDKLVLISMRRFVNDFFGAMKTFLSEAITDRDLRSKMSKRMGDILHVSSV